MKHLKTALKERDAAIIDLQDRLRELELATTADKVAREEVQRAEGEHYSRGRAGAGAAPGFSGRTGHANTAPEDESTPVLALGSAFPGTPQVAQYSSLLRCVRSGARRAAGGDAGGAGPAAAHQRHRSPCRAGGGDHGGQGELGSAH